MPGSHGSARGVCDRRRRWPVAWACGIILAGLNCAPLSAALWFATNFWSDTLGQSMPYEIVVPDSYGASNRLPVLYMLHGRTYHDTAWRLQAYTIITNAV